MANTMSSFLGGNTPCGFVSFFDELYNPYEKHRALIIKGGPGTGKSGIMKTVAKKAEEKATAQSIFTVQATRKVLTV